MTAGAVLLGRPRDAHVAALVEELPRHKLEPRVLDPRRFPAKSTLSVSISGKSAPRVASTLADFEDARVGWFSSRETVRLSGALAPASRAFARAASVAGLVSLRQAKGFAWVNDPWRAAHAGDKMWQLVLARERGFPVPETLLTNDPEAFAKFVRRRKRVAVKSPSGSAGLRPSERVLTNVVTPKDLKGAASVRHAPVLAQEYVEKRTEVRATVVGSQVFAVEIHSQETASTRVDWRRYDPRTRHERAHLPRAVERACVEVTRDAGLDYSGVDLIRTPREEYVFLEVNSEPAWLWVEDETDYPITRAIATLLKRRAPRS